MRDLDLYLKDILNAYIAALAVLFILLTPTISYALAPSTRVDEVRIYSKQIVPQAIERLKRAKDIANAIERDLRRDAKGKERAIEYIEYIETKQTYINLILEKLETGQFALALYQVLNAHELGQRRGDLVLNPEFYPAEYIDRYIVFGAVMDGVIRLMAPNVVEAFENTEEAYEKIEGYIKESQKGNVSVENVQNPMANLRDAVFEIKRNIQRGRIESAFEQLDIEIQKAQVVKWPKLLLEARACLRRFQKEMARIDPKGYKHVAGRMALTPQQELNDNAGQKKNAQKRERGARNLLRNQRGFLLLTDDMRTDDKRGQDLQMPLEAKIEGLPAGWVIEVIEFILAQSDKGPPPDIRWERLPSINENGGRAGRLVEERIEAYFASLRNNDLLLPDATFDLTFEFGTLEDINSPRQKNPRPKLILIRLSPISLMKALNDKLKGLMGIEANQRAEVANKILEEMTGLLKEHPHLVHDIKRDLIDFLPNLPAKLTLLQAIDRAFESELQADSLQEASQAI